MKKKMVAVLLTALMVCGLRPVEKQMILNLQQSLRTAHRGRRNIRLGICQLVQHESLDAANRRIYGCIEGGAGR
mgnify:CR=1 FL=1